MKNESRHFGTLKRHPVARFLSSPGLSVILLLLLVVLTFWGTIYQVEHGLQAARTRFFGSWLLLIFGFIPFPGVKSVMVVAILNVLGSLLFRIPFRKTAVGLHLTHLGIIVLLLGAGGAQMLSRESFIVLGEGEWIDMSADYRNWELVAYGQGNQMSAGDAPETIAVKELKPGSRHVLQNSGLRLEIEAAYRNAEPVVVKDERSGMSQIEGVRRLSPEKEASSNMPGLVLSVSMPGGPERRLSLWAGTGTPVAIGLGEDSGLQLGIRRKMYKLPVRLELIDFKKTIHPGTNVPKSFESHLNVTGGDVNREVVVSMNRPFRHGGWAFYQSAYSDRGGVETTTLAVVNNPMRHFPYAASLLMAAGLIIHFLIKLIGYTKKRDLANAS